jgi:hypothetical protein
MVFAHVNMCQGDGSVDGMVFAHVNMCQGDGSVDGMVFAHVDMCKRVRAQTCHRVSVRVQQRHAACVGRTSHENACTHFCTSDGDTATCQVERCADVNLPRIQHHRAPDRRDVNGPLQRSSAVGRSQWL